MIYSRLGWTALGAVKTNTSPGPLPGTAQDCSAPQNINQPLSYIASVPMGVYVSFRGKR